MHNDRVLTPEVLTTDVVARYRSKIAAAADPSACQIFTGARSEAGYGQLSLVIGGASRRVGAHRIGYVLATGESLTSRDIIDHLCHTPACQNPAHLRKTDARGNALTMVRSGRCTNGGRHHLGDEAVLELRRRWAAGEPVSALADGIGMSASSMRRLVRGRTYAHLPVAPRPQGNRGDGNPNAVLTSRRVSIIKSRLLLGHTQTRIARDEGVDHTTISCIARGRTWTHVEPAPFPDVATDPASEGHAA